MFDPIEMLGSLPGTNRYVNKKQSSFQDLLDFCNILNLHLEPSAKTVSSSIYHASNVLQTRIIDTNPYGKALYENLTEEEKVKFKRVKNQDALNKEYLLADAEKYHLKACGFVHAMAPSIFIKGRKALNFSKQHRLQQLIKTEYDLAKRQLHEIGLRSLKEEMKVLSSHYGAFEFLHLRFWFFDLDYPEFVGHDEILNNLESLGLLPYVACLVQTSPTKYHIYMKSEMICTEGQVKNWPTALSLGALGKTIDRDHLRMLSVASPRYSGTDWFNVAKRGVPSSKRLGDIPIPIPEEARLTDGVYLGDSLVYDSYLQSWHKIAKALGADPCTYDATRVAQLPGYSNPKNLYQAHILYHNRNAPVLTTKTARIEIEENIEKYSVLTKGKNIYEHARSQEVVRNEKYIRCNIDKAGIDTVRNGSDIRFTGGFENLKKLEVAADALLPKINVDIKAISAKPISEKNKSKKKFNRSRKARNMPDGYIDYVRVHGLIPEVLWDKDITGNSNRMLLLFCRYVKTHINLDEEYQRKLYFNTIIKPYFETRYSKDLAKSNWVDNFYSRFLSICKVAKKDLEAFLNQLDFTPKDEINTNNVKVIFEEQLQEKLGRSSVVFREVGHAKLRRLIYDAVGRSGRLVETGNGMEINFFIPQKAMVDSIGGRYRELLRQYEDTGTYKVDYKYERPYIDEMQVYNKGVCKKHTIFLKCDRASIIGDKKLYKKRLSKAEQRAETSNLLQELMRKKAEKLEKLEKVKAKGKLENVQTG